MDVNRGGRQVLRLYVDLCGLDSRMILNTPGFDSAWPPTVPERNEAIYGTALIELPTNRPYGPKNHFNALQSVPIIKL